MKKLAVAAVAALALIGLAGCASPQTSIVGPCTVTNATASGGDKGSVKYLVFTKECGVFTVEDAFLKNVWNSSDTFNEIHVGSVYNFETYGFRNGFISSYPNILTLKKVG
jgi:hypothetical protein